MINQSVIDTAKRYVGRIPQNMELKKAYLYGSYAKGNQHIDSDIDVAVIVGKMDDFFPIKMEFMRLRRTIDLRIEPHPIWEDDFNIQNPFAIEIQNTGIELI